MPTTSSETRKEKVNLLLPSPYDQKDLRAALSSGVRAERREAIAEVEAMEGAFEATNMDIVRDIAARLSRGRTPAAAASVMESTGAGRGAQASGQYISIDEIDPGV